MSDDPSWMFGLEPKPKRRWIMNDFVYRQTAEQFLADHPGPWRFGDAGLLLMDSIGLHLAWWGKGGQMDPNLRSLLLSLPEVYQAAAELVMELDDCPRPAWRPKSREAAEKLRRALKKAEMGFRPEPYNYAI